MTTKSLFMETAFLKDDECFGKIAPKPEKDVPLSVSALSSALRDCIEKTFGFVKIQGEISGLKKAASGHLYFALKDTQAVIDAVCWRSTAGKLSIPLEEGMEVVCTGKVTAYPSRSKYQIIVDSVQTAGIGTLLKLLEERRQKLQTEGLFAPERKKKIPFLPNVIGVVTSPTGAVIRDILHRINERFPTRVILWPSLVQGEDAAPQIAAGIRGFNAIPEDGLQTPEGIIPRPDVIIVARGGGSLEDLWCFNDEDVVRAAAASEIPLISAVGHETDTTLIDYASDLRAPTPTGAAEKAVPVRLEISAMLNTQTLRMTGAFSKQLEANRNLLTGLARGLPPLDRIIADYALKMDDRTERLQNAVSVLISQDGLLLEKTAGRLKHPDDIVLTAQNALSLLSRPFETARQNCLNACETRLQTAVRILESCSYKRILERGFALVATAEGKSVESASEAEKHKHLTLVFADGKTDVHTNSAKPAAKHKKVMDDKQGKLL